MLILTRKTGEVVRIGPNVYLTILGNDGYEVRLGFEAPKDIDIQREELYRNPKLKSNLFKALLKSKRGKK